jgi:crossover junction endodeoxyribonuclease RuvC
VLGLDPGSRACGWAVVEERGQGLALVAAGAIRPPEVAFEQRLDYIFGRLAGLIGDHAPAEAAVEGVFSAANARSALMLGHARGVALLSAARGGLAVHEYPPAAVKKAVAGGGRAAKEQVRAMVARLLGSPPDMALDASDACAVAICHLHSRRLGGLK